MRGAFLSGELSEQDLKAAIVSAVNALLEPVRQHFTRDAEAKRILSLITRWTAEPKGAPTTILRRCTAPLTSAAPHCVIFAPLSNAKPTLAVALDTLRCLATAPAGHARVLWLRDWSAFCRNCLGGGSKTRDDDLRAVAAADALFVAALGAMAPSLMAGVEVVRQSEALLTNSSDYWISVINAGRALDLKAVRAVEGDVMMECGHIITSLMHIADVLAVLSPGRASTVLCGTPEQASLHELAVAYASRPEVVAAGLIPPAPLIVPSVSLRLRSLEVKDAALDPDNELHLFDGQADVQRKMKKAFCEPRNVAHCPPIAVVVEAVLPYGEGRKLTVKRSPDDGGDLDYCQAESLLASYALGDLHPSDLKPSARDAVNAVLERVRAAVAADADLKKAQQIVASAAKSKAKR